MTPGVQSTTYSMYFQLPTKLTNHHFRALATMTE